MSDESLVHELANVLEEVAREAHSMGRTYEEGLRDGHEAPPFEQCPNALCRRAVNLIEEVRGDLDDER